MSSLPVLRSSTRPRNLQSLRLRSKRPKPSPISTGPAIWAPQGHLKRFLKGDVDIDVKVEVDVDIDRYLGWLKVASKSAQVLLNGIDAVMVLA